MLVTRSVAAPSHVTGARSKVSLLISVLIFILKVSPNYMGNRLTLFSWVSGDKKITGDEIEHHFHNKSYLYSSHCKSHIQQYENHQKLPPPLKASLGAPTIPGGIVHVVTTLRATTHLKQKTNTSLLTKSNDSNKQTKK